MGATWARMCDQHHLRRARIVNFTDTRFPISGTRLEFMGKAGFPFPVIFDSPIVWFGFGLLVLVLHLLVIISLRLRLLVSLLLWLLACS